MLSLIMFPYSNPNFNENWKSFLGLNKNRSFLRHILLPSAHQAYISNDPRINGDILQSTLVI